VCYFFPNVVDVFTVFCVLFPDNLHSSIYISIYLSYIAVADPGFAKEGRTMASMRSVSL